MKCPRDGTDLERSVYEAAVEIDTCPSCGGVWLDHGELERIQESQERDYSEELRQMPNLIAGVSAMADAKHEGPLACPACGRELEKREYGFCSQVSIDGCPSCRGVWLDKGELQRLEVFFERCRAETSKVRSGFLGSLLSIFE